MLFSQQGSFKLRKPYRSKFIYISRIASLVISLGLLTNNRLTLDATSTMQSRSVAVILYFLNWLEHPNLLSVKTGFQCIFLVFFLSIGSDRPDEILTNVGHAKLKILLSRVLKGEE